jgi:hypothetical protein
LETECNVNSGRTGHVYRAMLQMKTVTFERWVKKFVCSK